MKTRILHTKFWKDEFIMSLDTKGKCLFNYFLTNENNNLIGIYEIPEAYIALETGLTIPEIQEYKIKFQQAGKFVFYKSWVRIVNAERYNSYSGEKNEKAKERELSYVPEELMTMDTSIDTSIDSLLNHKSKTKNQKSEIKEQDTSIDTSMGTDNPKNPDGFEEFYKLYPNKKARGSAEKAYKKVAKHHEAIMEGLKTEIEYRKWADSKNKIAKTNSEKIFVPAWKHPATWLNQECWKDEYTGEFKKEQERIRQSELARQQEKMHEERKKLENLFSVTQAGFFNKKYGESGWSPFDFPQFMKNKKAGVKILDQEDHKEFSEYFKKLYPKEAAIIFTEKPNESI